MSQVYSWLGSKVYVILAIIIIIALGVSNNQLKNQIKDQAGNKVLQSKDSAMVEDLDSNTSAVVEYDENLTAYDPSIFPHISCISRLRYTVEPSNVYVSDLPYNMDFSRGNAGNPTYQDINGDNLPDFIYSYNNNLEGTNDIYNSYEACVYLNNGSGWDKAYECYAITEINKQSQTITRAEYRGDCAGTPTNNKE